MGNGGSTWLEKEQPAAPVAWEADVEEEVYVALEEHWQYPLQRGHQTAVQVGVSSAAPLVWVCVRYNFTNHSSEQS